MKVLPKPEPIVAVNKINKSQQEMLQKSKCCTKIEEMYNLIKAIGEKPFEAKQIYQGSSDGFTLEAFHRLCDDKGPTITIMKLEHNNHCIGGFTKAQWKATEKDSWETDRSAVVFNLTTAT